MSNSFIWPIDRTLSGATTPGQSGPGSDWIEGELSIRLSSGITEVSASDCLMSYSRLIGGVSYPYSEIQSVYSAIPVDWGK